MFLRYAFEAATDRLALAPCKLALSGLPQKILAEKR
jgi:hypothetical protein